MVKSMTGYGRAKKELGGRNILVEIKSVNNRYMDCSVKLPKLFGFLEEKIKSYISAKGISRGKIEIYVSIDILEEIGVSVELDTAYAKSYIDALRRLSEEFGLPNDITTMAVAANRDIFSVKKTRIWKENGITCFPFSRRLLSHSSRQGNVRAPI